MKKKKTKKKKIDERGRPIVIDEEKAQILRGLCRTKMSQKDCAAILGVSEITIGRYCKSHGMDFVTFRDVHLAPTRNMIIRQILKLCQEGHFPALVYASKNLCGWTDKQEVDHTNSDGSNKRVIVVMANNLPVINEPRQIEEIEIVDQGKIERAMQEIPDELEKIEDVEIYPVPLFPKKKKKVGEEKKVIIKKNDDDEDDDEDDGSFLIN